MEPTGKMVLIALVFVGFTVLFGGCLKYTWGKPNELKTFELWGPTDWRVSLLILLTIIVLCLLVNASTTTN